MVKAHLCCLSSSGALHEHPNPGAFSGLHQAVDCSVKFSPLGVASTPKPLVETMDGGLLLHQLGVLDGLLLVRTMRANHLRLITFG